MKSIKKQTMITVKVFMLICICSPCFSSSYYVSTDGNDLDPGTQQQPFKTINMAVKNIQAGDTIYIRGGNFRLSSTLLLNTSGLPLNPTNLWAYQDEIPVLDASAVSNGIEINGDFWHLNGIAVSKAGNKGIQINGSNNIIERILTYENIDGGLKIDTGAAHNLILNCDSYMNYDKPGGGNADGFAAKHGIGKGNVFKGCRAWNNSDDGFDLMEASNAVILEKCWAWGNGQNIWSDPNFEGNGVGYKLGAESGAHQVIRCLAWKNSSSGFNVQENTSGITLYNNSAWDNHVNYFFDDSNPHKLRNNLSYIGKIIMWPEIDDTNNSWNIKCKITQDDFLSLDDSNMNTARESNGSLPESKFLNLSPGSDLIDSGIDMGIKYNGDAPDLGGIEFIGHRKFPED